MQSALDITIWNANGLINNRPEVELYCKTNQADILLISETHFSDRSYFTLRGYDLVSAIHPNGSARGGAAILIRSSIKFDTQPPIQEDWVQCARISVSTTHGDITLAAAYCPPRFRATDDCFSSLLDSLGPKFVIGGDFNAKHTWWGSRVCNPKGRALCRQVLSRNLNCHGTGTPTYWPTDPAKTPDILDFAISGGLDPARIQTREVEDLLSDHSAIAVSVYASAMLRSAGKKLIFKTSDIRQIPPLAEQLDSH